MATEHLKCDQRNWRTECLIYFGLISFHLKRHVGSGYTHWTVQLSSVSEGTCKQRVKKQPRQPNLPILRYNPPVVPIGRTTSRRVSPLQLLLPECRVWSLGLQDDTADHFYLLFLIGFPKLTPQPFLALEFSYWLLRNVTTRKKAFHQPLWSVKGSNQMMRNYPFSRKGSGYSLRSQDHSRRLVTTYTESLQLTWAASKLRWCTPKFLTRLHYLCSQKEEQYTVTIRRRVSHNHKINYSEALGAASLIM